MVYWTSGPQFSDGKYIIEAILGTGGFGVTYRAREQPSGKLVAIKTLNTRIQQKSDFDKYQEKFLNEALCLAKCSHPHIVKVHKVFQHQGLWCMVMEYIAGHNLAQYIDERGVLSEEEALRIVRQIGEALTAVHSQGFLHRDVKPLNILLRQDTRDAVLIDFGLAREFTSGIAQTHTNQKTERFAPVEQYEKKAERGAYTDVYALAATLYVLLTGELPVSAEFRDKANIPLMPPKQHNAGISDRVNQAILKGMALQPKDRPQTVGEWLKLLEPPLFKGGKGGILQTFRVVIAIDFGTSSSGYAYAFKDDWKVIGRCAWPGQKVKYPKTPTHLLYSPDGTLEEWGAKALKRITQLRSNNQAKLYSFFSNFPLALSEIKTRTDEGPYLEQNGHIFMGVNLIADYLR